jgi:Uma2 family endonuclease
VNTFYRAIAGGVFDEPKRLELVNGELWEREPVNPPHAALTRRILRLFRNLFEPGFLVVSEQPLHLTNDGEPVPDVYVAIGSEEDYEDRHPTSEEARLVVEVADSSVERDTNEKSLVYARAGIQDYWVSLVGARQLLVYRNPSSEGYPEPLRLNEYDTIRPLSAPEVEIPVHELLSRASVAAGPAPDQGA